MERKHRALLLDLPMGQGRVGGHLGHEDAQPVAVGLQHQVHRVGAALDQVLKEIPHRPHPQGNPHQGGHPRGLFRQK